MTTVAVLIPCYNEALSIAQVVHGFKAALPQATIYVYDNNSTDGTATVAAGAGAVVRHESRQGKGYVISRMFADIESDVYVLVDGDATYPAEVAPAMVRSLIDERLDMVVGVREAQEDGAYRRYHRIGNRGFNWLMGRLFARGMSDIFSGYRVFSHRFVKSFPALSHGFEIETEMSVHALTLAMPFAEQPVRYAPRQDGSSSKLRTWRDGGLILLMMLRLFKQMHPFKLFTGLSLVFVAAAFGLGWPIVLTWLETGLVPRIPTAIIVVGLGVLALVAFTTGIVLEGIMRMQHENRRLNYLRLGLRT